MSASLWFDKKLSEIADVRDGTHDSPKPSVTGFPLVTSKHIVKNKVNLSNTYLISENDFNDINKRSKVDRYDLLLSMIGTVGEVALIKEQPKFAIKNVGLIKTGNKTLGNYLFYYLISPLGRNTILKLLSGSTQKFISLGQLRNFPVSLPIQSVQENIVSILSGYTDLIENNEKRIKILEEMARGIYTEWFIKFKFPGYEKIKTVESGTEFGLIPDGWEVKKILDIAREKRDPANPKNIDTETPYVGLEHLPRKSLVLSDWGKASQVGSTKHKFKKGNIIFGKIRPYFHKVVVAPLDGITSTDSIVIEPLDDKYFGLVAMYVSSENFVKFATTTSQGTKMPRAEWKTLTQYPVCIPDGETVEKFNMVITDIIDQMNKLMMINRNLKCIRDLLIPQLVTGKRELKS